MGMEKGAESKKTNVLRLEKYFSESGMERSCTGTVRREQVRSGTRSGNVILDRVRSGPDQEMSAANKSVPHPNGKS
jgi:hypothetical protein